MSSPKLSDPATTPLHPYRGDARRERPTREWTDFGPWRATVRLTPVRPRKQWVFEVNVQWEAGPGLDGRWRTGPDGTEVPCAVSDVWVDEDHELASLVAQVAVDHLKKGRQPDLRRIAELARRRAIIRPE